MLLYDTTYAVVGFGEAPGTLWVWVPGLPKLLFFLLCKSGGSCRAENKKILEGLRPSKPP